MNIWVEYWEKEENSINTHAQIRELAKWKEPDPKKVSRRFSRCSFSKLPRINKTPIKIVTKAEERKLWLFSS